MPLDGIDISGYQRGIDLARVPHDFMIAYGTGGASIESPRALGWVEQERTLGGLPGLYHYAGDDGRGASAADEAAIFIRMMRAALQGGHCMAMLDWEGVALRQGPGWACEWLDRVEQALGLSPLLYSYGAELRAQDYSSIAARWPDRLFLASYYDGYNGKGYQPDVGMALNVAPWRHYVMRQYTGQGRLPGWGGIPETGHYADLDLNRWAGSRGDWIRMATPGGMPAGGGATPIGGRMVTEQQIREWLPETPSDDDSWYLWCQRLMAIICEDFGVYRQTYGRAIWAYNADATVIESTAPGTSPAGAFEWWAWDDYGHVGLSLGGGRVLMTSAKSAPFDETWAVGAGVLNIHDFNRKTGLRYLGWSRTNGLNSVAVGAAITSTVPKEDSMAILIRRTTDGTVALVAPEFWNGFKSMSAAQLSAAVWSQSDEIHQLDASQFDQVTRALGIPDEVRVAGVWSREGQTATQLAEIAEAVAKLSTGGIDLTALVKAASEGAEAGAKQATSGLTLKAV